GGVAGVDARLLDVLHDTAQVQFGAVVEGVHVDLDGFVEEAVHQHRVFGTDFRVALDVVGEHGLVVDDLHAAAAEHVGGADQHRVADLFGDGPGFVEGLGGAVLGGGQPGFGQDPAELAAVFGQVDRLGAGAHDRHPGFFELLGQAERGLAAQLHDHADDFAGLLFGAHHFEHVFQGQRLEVQPVAGVVVGGDRLRVAVDHDGLVAGLRQGEGRVDAAVVELHALADPVGSGAEDDDLGLAAGRDLGLLVVAGVQVGRGRGELGGAGVHGQVDRVHVEGVAQLPHDFFGAAGDLADLRVGEAELFGGAQQVRVEAGRGGEFAGLLVQPEDLVEEPRVDLGGLVEFRDRGPGPQGLLDLAQPVFAGGPDRPQQLLFVPGVSCPGEGAAFLLQRPHGLLQRFGEGPADRHDFADRLHGGGQAGVGAGELLEREPRHFDDDVVQGRLEAGQRLGGDVVGDLVEGVADGELGRDLRDGEPGGFGRQRRGPGDARVHLDDDGPPGLGVDRELDVAAAGVDPDFADDGDPQVAQ